jgi:hypothetical protein
MSRSSVAWPHLGVLRLAAVDVGAIPPDVGLASAKSLKTGLERAQCRVGRGGCQRQAIKLSGDRTVARSSCRPLRLDAEKVTLTDAAKLKNGLLHF